MRQRTKSTESKGSSDSDKKNEDLIIDDLSGINLDALRSKVAPKSRRDSTGTIRRGSESGNGKHLKNSQFNNRRFSILLLKY